MSDLSIFQQRLAEKRAREAAEAAKVAADTPPVERYDADLIPEYGYERSAEDEALDTAIKNIDIVRGYSLWSGKPPPTVRSGQVEGVKISCPKPNHPDKRPSAWLNLEKGTWFCGGCQEGGDVYDIAAYHFGFPVPGYKEGAKFHELRRKMAESLGFTFIQPPGSSNPIPVAPEPQPESSQPGAVPAPPVPSAETAEDPPPPVLATVTDISAAVPTADDDIEFPTLDWNVLMEANTFLETYMGICQADDVPEEYHLWNGLLALGLAVGRDVALFDRVPVFGNLFVCLLGNTGDGKSRSYGHLRRLLSTALPHKWDDPLSKGTHIVGTPASAEVLIHNFSKPVPDPVNPKVTAFYAPVRGLVEFSELSALLGRSNRQGNVLKPTLMEFYDMSPAIMTSSMTTGKKEASNPFGSVFTTTQPRALKELVRQSDADSGFLNRWIFASGRQKNRVAIGGAEIDITDAVKPLQSIQGWAGFGKTIQWDPDAAALFTEFFHDTLHPKQIADGSGLLTRMDLTMKKLVLLLTINLMLPTVPLRVVQQVLSMYNYLIAAYAIPAAQIGNTAQIEIQEELLRMIQSFQAKHGLGPTYREIGQRIKHKKFQPDLVHKMLKILVDMGELELYNANAGKPGRPSVRYRYVG